MKIKNVTNDAITFDNDMQITFDHDADCCECNYADFQQLDDLARNYEFDENLKFRAVEDAGFTFGDDKAMFFVPCYSEQNGYYSCDIDIYFDGRRVLNFNCEEVIY